MKSDTDNSPWLQVSMNYDIWFIVKISHASGHNRITDISIILKSTRDFYSI